MNYFLFLFFGLAPSLVWLLFYLRKDAHPEPKHMVLKVFVWAGLITIPVIFLEGSISKILQMMPLPQQVREFLSFLIVVALVEELAKYAIVKWKVFSRSVLDEPLDVMLYMIISALGFAAFENILKLFLLDSELPLSFLQVMRFSILRFVGATFLHGLASALFGYCLALSFFNSRQRHLYFILGLACSTALHGVFNLYIIRSEGLAQILLPTGVLMVLGFFVSVALEHLKKLKSVCQV